MNAICPIHDVQMEEKSGQYGSYFSHRTQDGYCNGKKITPFKTNGFNPVSPPATGSVAIPVAKKYDSMLMCNAMNNAVALVNGGMVEASQLEDAFTRILGILESKT